jgi:hypothetical protein
MSIKMVWISLGSVARPSPAHSLPPTSPVHGASPGAAGIIARSFYGRVRRQPREAQGVSTSFPEPASANIPPITTRRPHRINGIPVKHAVQRGLMGYAPSRQGGPGPMPRKHLVEPLKTAHFCSYPPSAGPPFAGPSRHPTLAPHAHGQAGPAPAKKRRIAHKKILKTKPI